MARISKSLILVGIGLSTFTVTGIFLAITDTLLPGVKWGRRGHPATVLGVGYLMIIFAASQSKTRLAVAATSLMSALGYISLFAFFAWIIWSALQ
jgi:hypothetical protein